MPTSASASRSITRPGTTTRATIEWIDSELFEDEDPSPGSSTWTASSCRAGSGIVASRGMIQVAQYAREHQVPYLGLCLGLQVMVIELARHRLGLDDANSAEFNLFSRDSAIDIARAEGHLREGRTMRLGRVPVPAWRGYAGGAGVRRADRLRAYRHRYELNNEYRPQLAEVGLVTSGLSLEAGWWRSASSTITRGCSAPSSTGAEVAPEPAASAFETSWAPYAHEAGARS